MSIGVDRWVQTDVDRRIEREVVDRARGGDHDAWESIYRVTYPRLHAYAARRAGDAADDLVGETLMRAVTAIGRFHWTDEGVEPWLFGIARHVIADHHRRAGRRRRTAPPQPPSAQADEGLVIADEHAAVRRAFDGLPATDREVLELRVVAGLSPDQVARLLGKRPGAVRTAQSRALARLRRELGS